ncbi:MAG: bifunctional riboflavin kinase/FAD synthetase [Eubacterium sp.]|nr:bifunctional riboflavin kinase/FAD synthetase [Eubacterium sp.]
MELVKGTTQLQLEQPTAVSFGKFDGLHMGHKLLVERLLTQKKEGLQTVAFSFDVPPALVTGGQEAKVLTTNEEKIFVFSKTGIDYLIEYPFTDEIRNMEAIVFLEKIVADLHVRHIIVGTDFRFGYNRKGDAQLLKEQAKRLGYRLDIVEKMQYGHRDISSTMIRKFIAEGQVETANLLLGYPYFMQGVVECGKKIGRTIGIPTVNLLPASEKLLPPYGAYASRITVNGKSYSGITNIGDNPTVEHTGFTKVESHIFDFHEMIYGQQISVEFLEFLRGEKKFESLEALKKQIEHDIQYVKSKY